MSSSIRTQLAAVNEQIADLRLLLEEKKEELRRLKEAQSDLISNKNDFQSEEEICLEPEFSTKTFHGRNAEKFDGYRRITLKETFREIPVTQIANAIADMQVKINELVEEIEMLEAKIEALEERRSILLARLASAKSS